MTENYVDQETIDNWSNKLKLNQVYSGSLLGEYDYNNDDDNSIIHYYNYTKANFERGIQMIEQIESAQETLGKIKDGEKITREEYNNLTMILYQYKDFLERQNREIIIMEKELKKNNLNREKIEKDFKKNCF